MVVPFQTPPVWQSAQALAAWTPASWKDWWVYLTGVQAGSANLWQESQVVGMPLAAWGGVFVAL